jgi:uncharacterized protein YegL
MHGAHENGNHGSASDGVLHVAFVLDKSGSMQVVEEAVVAGYNDYLDELRGQGGETRFSLTTFDTHFEHVCLGEPLNTVAELDHRTYCPGGSTALFDAIGHTVLQTERRLREEGRNLEKVLVVVMTDGLENASTDYDAHAIAELVRSYEERPNWTFVYLGAGHDTIDAARETAAQMGYKPDNAMRWAADPLSVRKSMQSLAYATEFRRRARSLKSELFFIDAGQTAADYEQDANDPAQPERPVRPRRRWSAPTPATIRRRKLSDALLPPEKRDGRRRGS